MKPTSGRNLLDGSKFLAHQTQHLTSIEDPHSRKNNKKGVMLYGFLGLTVPSNGFIKECRPIFLHPWQTLNCLFIITGKLDKTFYFGRN